ncbi:hypothetical protein CKA32_002264 [Geitlerinema sp. FC II]|nr:hypothetical protein CKA32_002264 [Geitlerinema sp. FC II]
MGGVHCRCVTISRSHDRYPIFQVTHPTEHLIYQKFWV